MKSELTADLATGFIEHFGHKPERAAFAPGRIEVLGNHTDYNEGLVLSCAIDRGLCFVASNSDTNQCRVFAANVREEASFEADAPKPRKDKFWVNYVAGVYDGLLKTGLPAKGFNGALLGNLPIGSGLSSSAALEISAALTLSSIMGNVPDLMTLARIGQQAEHTFAGTKCGLLDQISSLYGKENHLVMTDFRTLDIQTVPFDPDYCFLICNTHTKHALSDGTYNERRESCERASDMFKTLLDRPVTALRDVTSKDLYAHKDKLPVLAAKRAAHVIGENERVASAARYLKKGDLEEFGKLMFQSHQSSIENFENSCAELDTVVNSAKQIPGVLGARLSGGGFGGSAIILANQRDTEAISHAINKSFEKAHGRTCDIIKAVPSAGAHLIQL